MNRKILIITNPGDNATDENYCKGVFVDRDNYVSFFTTPSGGYWQDNEIVCLDRPSANTVKEKLVAMNNCDFSIIIFCGHGFYSSISNSNILELSKGERLDSLDLRNNARKRIIILDSCRKVHAEYVTEALIKSRMFSESLSALKQLNKEECKRYYNKRVSECENQIIVCYGADINEYANDSSATGGYYSSSLLKRSREYIDSKLTTIDLTKNYYIWSIVYCHDGAVPYVLSLSGRQQNPQIDKPRKDPNKEYLPFTIVA